MKEVRDMDKEKQFCQMMTFTMETIAMDLETEEDFMCLKKMDQGSMANGVRV